MYVKGLALLLLWVPATLVAAEDWTRFRGPNGGGISESKIPVSWTPEANVAWKGELPGPGVSSPIVVGDKVFVTCYSGYGVDRGNPGDIEDLMRHLVCFDANTGEKLWQKDVKAAQPEDPYTGIGVTAHGYASHTPVSDGKNVYVFFGKSGAFGFDMEGNQLWQHSVGTESDPRKWGSSSSPILYDNILIVTAAAESQSVVGIDTETGKELWRSEATGLDNMWGTPVLAEVSEGRTDLVMAVPREVWGLDPKTGKLLWYVDASGSDQAQSSPVVTGDKVYAVTGRGGGSVAVDVSENAKDSNVEWTGRETGSYASPIRLGDKLYNIAGGVVSVIDAESGRSISRARLEGAASGGGRGGSSDYPSPVVAGDYLYYINGKGHTFVFSLGDEIEQVSLNVVTTEDESFGGSPAVANNKMYLRSSKHIYCIADTGKEVAPNASAEIIASMSEGQGEAEGGRGRGGQGRGGQGRGGEGRGGQGQRGGGNRFDPAAFFERLDENSDKKITKEELEGSPLADRFDDLDENKDGSLNLEEFQASMRNFGRGGGQRGGGGNRGGGFGGRGGGGGNDRPDRPQRPDWAKGSGEGE